MGLLAACALALRALSACGEIHGTETLPGPTPNGGTPTELAQSTPGTGDLAAAGGTSGAAPDSSTDNGQTGSLTPDSQCYLDAECAPRVESWIHPDFEYQLLDSSCEYAQAVRALGPGAAPSCVCRMAVTGPFQDKDAFEIPHPYVRKTEERVFVLGAGERQQSLRGEPRCLLESERRAPYQCNYWDFEFPGCAIDSGDSACNGICGDAVQRLQAQTQTPHEIEVRLAECRMFGVGEYHQRRCVSAVRVDDQCYNSSWTPVSCSLSNEEIVQSPYADPPLEQPRLVSCSRAEDCPGGLGCDGSRCGPCVGPGETWTTPDAVLHDGPDFPCGAGEVCSHGTCLLEQRARCQSDSECTTDSEPWRTCVNTGVSNLTVRGNENSESYCLGEHANAWGLEPGDVLQATPLGPSTEVDAAFQPPPYPYAGVGCDEIASGPLTFAVAQTLPGYVGDTQLERPGATPLPPPVPPRDPPQGRQLYSENGLNYLQLWQQGSGPYTVRGCSGQARFTLDILSENREQARARAADGSFPTTVLEFDFRADHPADLSCVGLEARWCTEHVELKRLTP